jgi:hypothetical protein
LGDVDIDEREDNMKLDIKEIGYEDWFRIGSCSRLLGTQY